VEQISRWLRQELDDGKPSDGFYGFPYDETGDTGYEKIEGQAVRLPHCASGRASDADKAEASYRAWEASRAKHWRLIREANPRPEEIWAKYRVSIRVHGR